MSAVEEDGWKSEPPEIGDDVSDETCQPNLFGYVSIMDAKADRGVCHRMLWMHYISVEYISRRDAHTCKRYYLDVYLRSLRIDLLNTNITTSIFVNDSRS